jgi:hypothetical protein
VPEGIFTCRFPLSFPFAFPTITIGTILCECTCESPIALP